ncbi:hypothetical protein SAMN05216582_1032 [Selenomonas ruminantium]|uniref:Uncharacterized protein n=1 Tax=Selenomonas ruminantium TaxID=971 RepID=A0A1M6RXR8_SELRU|nr:hypothetical protein [Selenomonas ruminantium]SHK37128.1 hypothetical protein SAMN05216582_1032 [Selenomonas ruminantium]
MAKLKYIILALLVIGVAGVAGYYAAIQYDQTRAVVQAEQDKKEAARKAVQAEKEAKEAAQREKARRKQALIDKRTGRAEEPDQVIRGLTADMLVAKEMDGSTYYRYEDPTEDGIFIQPYLVRDAGGNAVIHIILRHRGQRPMGFHGVGLQTGEDSIYFVRTTGNVVTAKTNSGIMEWCDQIADTETLKAMREVGDQLAGKILMLGVDGGSNDDRMLSAVEANRIKNILELCDILNGKKET